MESTLHSARVWKYTLTVFVVLFSVLLTSDPINAAVQLEHLDKVDAIIVEMELLSADWDNVSDGKPSTSSLTPKLKAKLSNEVRHAAKRLEQARRDLSKDHAEKAYHHLQQSVDALALFQQYLSQSLTEGQLDAAAVTRLHQHSDAIIVQLQQCLSLLSENHAPVADAGLDQVLDQPGIVNLDGSGSYDQDGDPLLFSWDLTVQPEDSAALLDDASAQMPSFQAEVPGLYQARLIVNDGHYDSEPDTVEITVQYNNAPPVAVAGEDHYVTVGQTVFLDAGASYDTDGDPLSYHWTLLSTPASSTAVLSDANQMRSHFTPDLPGQYSLQLIVNDGSENSAPDGLVVYVQAANVPPVAVAGPDQSAYLNEQIQLDGSASSDADVDAITYQWTFLTKPEGSLAELDNPLAVYPQFMLDVSGDYSIQLVVNDGQADSEPDQVVVSTLNSQPVADAGPDQTLTAGDSLTLDGSASYDADQDPLNYNWSITVQPEQSQVSLPEPTLMQPQVQLTEAGFYVFQLIVDDGHVSSTPDTVNVEVAARPPLQLTLAHPPQDWITNIATLTFTGHLNQAASLTLNGTPVTLESDLSFSQAVTLNEGINAYILHADNGLGDTLSLTRTLTLDTQAPVIDASRVAVAQPDAQGQVIITGAVDSVEPYATVTSVNLQNNETQTTTAFQDGSFHIVFKSNTASVDYEIIAQDQAGNTSLPINVNDGGIDDSLPPDPASVAPALETNRFTSMAESVEFLYSGDNPIQTLADPGSMVAERVAVIRGVVQTDDNQPLPGVIITIKDHPEYGETKTRSDGAFDIAVNGGGLTTINYSKSGYLPIQRQVQVPWNDFVFAEDVIMIPLDPKFTVIDLNDNSQAFQVAQGSVNTDIDGSRQATVLFPQGLTATLQLPNGCTQTLNQMTFRATEYTVGENGPARMPGLLPPASAYTYAVELSVDEALAAGSDSVLFNKPVPVYVDNFLDFPVGEAVPVGFYNKSKAVWVPSNNGQVIKIIQVIDGKAVLDVDGDDFEDSSQTLADLGITLEEQIELAKLFTAGKSFWRFQTEHLTPWDCNFPYGPPGNAIYPKKGPWKGTNNTPDKTSETCGCIIDNESQVLGESVSLSDIPLRLNYTSSRATGYLANRQLKIPLSEDSVPSSLQNIRLTIWIAGSKIVKTFPALPNQNYVYTWNGKDSYGRPRTSANAYVQIEYLYPAEYYSSLPEYQNSFAIPGLKREDIKISRRSLIVSLKQKWKKTLYSNLTALTEVAGLGGLTIDIHHAFDRESNKLYLGTGKTIGRKNLNPKIIAGKYFSNGEVGPGSGAPYYSIPATEVNIADSSKLSLAPDGGFFLSNGLFWPSIVTSEGLISTLDLGLLNSIVTEDYLLSAYRDVISDGDNGHY